MLKTHHHTTTATTTGAPDFVDITDDVQAALGSSGIGHGQVTVFAPTPGCSILVNERETGLLHDLRVALERLRPVWPTSALGSQSVVLPASDGRLGLGIWQRILLVELSEASSRPVLVHVMGEA